MIDEEKKAVLTRAVILGVSLAVHAVVLFIAFTVQTEIKIIQFRPKRADVILVQAPRIKFTAVPPGSASAPASRAGAAGPGIAAPGRQPANEELRRAADQGGGEGGGGGRGGVRPGGAPPLGGSPGTLLGGGGIVRRDREGESSYSSRFSLVYPADAMIHLDRYARVPEDAWLRPYRPPKPTTNLSPFALSTRAKPPGAGPAAGGTGSGGAGGGGTGRVGGGIGMGKTAPAGVVAAYVPENVRLFDLSGWANDVLNAVQRNWTLGADAGAAEWSGQVTVTILVMKSGEINGVDVNVSSSIEPLDKSVLRAIRQSGPWPGLPEGYPETSHEIQ